MLHTMVKLLHLTHVFTTRCTRIFVDWECFTLLRKGSLPSKNDSGSCSKTYSATCAQ